MILDFTTKSFRGFFLNSERKSNTLVLPDIEKKKCSKKLRCIPLSGNIDGIQGENTAREIKQVLEPIMQYWGFYCASPYKVYRIPNE